MKPMISYISEFFQLFFIKRLKGFVTAGPSSA